MICGYYFIKVFYFGDQYHGSAHQPDQNTVEDELFKALQKKGYIPKGQYKQSKVFHAAGRTDKKVHSRAMVFGFFNFRRKFYPIEVNRSLPDDIIIWASCLIHNREELIKKGVAVGEELPAISLEILKSLLLPRFNALQRHYRYIYYDANKELDISRMKLAAEKLRGTHDFTNLCKVEPDRKTERTLDVIDIHRKDDFIIFDFIALSFLWHQIRKTVYVLLKIGMKDWSEKLIEDLLNPIRQKISSKVGLAPAKGLILWDIIYPDNILFNICSKSLSIIKRDLNTHIYMLQIRTKIAKSIRDSF
ncbi:MAG: hypothetical protein GF364_11220 [Candidatus Lokiarchaeota archaeon]|nr:hypothetical protein [Candidatus Lokiarchaeota archaeon]